MLELLTGLGAAEWVLIIGAIGTALGGVIKALHVAGEAKAEGERAREEMKRQRALDHAETLRAAQASAVEASNQANAVLRSSLESMQRHVDSIEEKHDKETSELRKELRVNAENLATANKHIAVTRQERATAIHHIAERESWAMQHWNGQRPATLPAIPASIAADVRRILDPEAGDEGALLDAEDVCYRPREPPTT